MKNRVYATCIRTYVDEQDMMDFVNGEKKPHEVKVYHKGRKYLVVKDYVDLNYYKL
jgi:hypothetical protein